MVGYVGLEVPTHTFPAALTPASVLAALERSTFFGSVELSLEIAPISPSALKTSISIVLAEVGSSVN